MKKTDKSLIQERIIDKQQEEIKILKRNNENLEALIEIYEGIPNVQFEDAKELICILNEKINIYNQLVSEAKEIKEKYKKTLKEINELKLEYVKDMNTVMKDIQKGTKKLK